MPIYEYRCRDCATTFSRLQRVGASTDGVACPQCTGTEVERRLSAFAAATPNPSSGCAPSGST